MNSPEFHRACGQAQAALWNLQAWLEREYNLTGIEAAQCAAKILDSVPTCFLPHAVQSYIDLVREARTSDINEPDQA